MARGRVFFSLTLLALLLGLGNAVARERDLLYARSASGKLQQLSRNLRDPQREKTPGGLLTWNTEYFVRIAPRGAVMDGNSPKDGARLGTKPFVFLTSPESLYGRSLLEIYQDIGYEAEDILRWQQDQDMVAIVFRYPPEIAVSEVRDGRLGKNWQKTVYVPTWDNIFALFHLLAQKAATGPSQPTSFERMAFKSGPERAFILGFPAEGKARIKKATYAGLKATGGADWTYRRLLEEKLGAFEHFRGNGRTQNEVTDPQGIDAGLVEFVGPNKKLSDLAEVAVIHLGRLTIADSYGPRSPSTSR